MPVAGSSTTRLDGQTIALAAETGEELWRTQLGDINLGETITMAPLVVRAKVMVGNSGGELSAHLAHELVAHDVARFHPGMKPL